MTAIADVDISSPAFKANPYPFYAQLRARRRFTASRLATSGPPGW